MSDTAMIMGDAGKAMPVPRGQYSDTETYDYLDFVYSGDASYIAKKLTTGNPPAEDNEYWQLLARGGTLTENSDVSNTTVTFEEAENRINIFSKDSLSVIAGKIKKWFADLKTVAFSGKYSDLEGRLTVTNNDLANVPGTAWDAVRGAAIRQDVDKLNSNLATKRIYAPILNWISDEILKSSASITNTKYGMVIFGLVTNNPLFPTLDWYYVMQISGGASGSNFKLTFAYSMTGAEDSKTLYVSYDYHTSDTPTWRKFSAPTKL